MEMITFSYDETAGFEAFDSKNCKAPTLLAGVLYCDNDEGKIKISNNRSIEAERIRLIKYFSMVCNECGTVFPVDLHMKKNKSNAKANKKTEKKINETLPEFIAKGTYKGEELIWLNSDDRLAKEKAEQNKPVPRKGCYQLLTLYRDGKGKTMDITGAGILNNEVSASNQYLNMTKSMIFKALCANPFIDTAGSSFKLDIPTRTYSFKRHDFENDQIYLEVKTAFEKAGYRHEQYKEGERFVDYWVVVSNGTIQQQVKDIQKIKAINIEDLLVESIDYGEIRNNNPKYELAFLYLADSLCTYLRDVAKAVPVRPSIRRRYVSRVEKDIKDLLNCKELSREDKEILKTLRHKIRNRYVKEVLSEDIPKIKNVNDIRIKSAINKWNNYTDPEYTYEERVAIAFRKALRTLNPAPAKNLFFYYNDMDNVYDEAVAAALCGDVFKSLSNIYDCRHMYKGYAKQYYSKRWVKQLENLIINTTDINTLSGAINQLDLYSTHRHEKYKDLDPGKLFYIFVMLEKIKDHLIATKSKEEILGKIVFDLYDVGISAYSHIGNPKGAQRCYEECIRFEGAEKDEQTLVGNKIITMLNDSLDYSGAIKHGLMLLGMNPLAAAREESFKGKLMKLIKPRKRSEAQIVQDNAINNIPRETGFKVIGSLGQSFAFSNDNRAEECFLTIIQNDKRIEDRGNILMTMSYLLQWYIETGNKEEYEKWASSYFGNNDDLNKQFEYILFLIKNEKKNTPSFRFALFVFIKAFYKFYKSEEKYADVLKKLVDINNTVRNAGGNTKMKGHPWEIIYKYAAMLELYYQEGRNTTNNRKNIYESVKNEKEFIIDRIIENGDIEYMEERINRADMDPERKKRVFLEKNRKINSLYEKLVEHGCIETDDGCDIEEKRRKKKKKMSYMYH